VKKALVLVLNGYTHDSRVERQVEALRKLGYFTSVFALHEKGLELRERYPFHEVRRFRLLTRPLPKHKIVHVLKYAECIAQMCWASWRVKPALVHANDLDALPIGYLAARLRRSRLVYDAHELWAGISGRENFHPIVFALARWLEGTIARRADHVITVGGCIADHMAQNLKIPRPTVVRNVSAASKSGRSINGGLREALGVSREVPIVLYLGGMVPGRGLETAIRAFTRVGGPAILVLMGQCSDSYRSTLSGLAEHLGIADRVVLLDPVPSEDVLRCASEATIGIAPIEGSCLNHRYSLSNKVFQYLQAGLPLLVSDLPEMASLVAQYNIGVTFTDGDASAFAETLNGLLASPERLAYFANNSRKSAPELSWEREEQILLKVYDELERGTVAGSDGMKSPIEAIE
jgi:glycosyltransferase involved in cell wall biosynthesis